MHAFASLPLDIGKYMKILRLPGLLWIHQFGMVGIGERLTTKNAECKPFNSRNILLFF